MITVPETMFARRVLRAEQPVLVCFGARACPGRQALRPALERLGAARQNSIAVAMVLLDHAPLLAEQHGVIMSPTLVAFEGGDRLGQVLGFIPEGMLGLLADDVVAGLLSDGRFWSPVEERFEDSVMIPLLQSWGLTVQRQVACPLPGRNRAQRGRVDLLVYDGTAAPALTLIESKRQIRGDDELRQAAQQAAAYARSLALPSFVVAAPRGLWVYQLLGERSRCARHISALELHHAPEQLLQLLVELRSGAAA